MVWRKQRKKGSEKSEKTKKNKEAEGRSVISIKYEVACHGLNYGKY